MILINITHGRADAADIGRAVLAAESVLAGIDVVAAQAEFIQQMDDRGDADLLTDLAAKWHEAATAADLALTVGWADPDGASCDIEAIHDA